MCFLYGFIEKLVVTDEAALSMDRSVNTKNTRFWSINEPEGNVYEKSYKEKSFLSGPDFAVIEGFWGPSSMIEIQQKAFTYKC